MTVVLPTNIGLPSTVRVSLSETDPRPLELDALRMMPSGLFADGAWRNDLRIGEMTGVLSRGSRRRRRDEAEYIAGHRKVDMSRASLSLPIFDGRQ